MFKGMETLIRNGSLKRYSEKFTTPFTSALLQFHSTSFIYLLLMYDLLRGNFRHGNSVYKFSVMLLCYGILKIPTRQITFIETILLS